MVKADFLRRNRSSLLSMRTTHDTFRSPRKPHTVRPHGSLKFALGFIKHREVLAPPMIFKVRTRDACDDERLCDTYSVESCEPVWRNGRRTGLKILGP